MRNQFDDIVTSLRVKRNELREELREKRYEVEERIRTLDEAIKVLSTGPAPLTDKVVARTDTFRLLMTRIVASHSYPWRDKYEVTAWYEPVKNLFVYRCSCPAFKFAKPDAAYGGEKAYCKHIRVELRRDLAHAASDALALSRRK